MKNNLLCIFIAISWALALADSLTIPPSDEKPEIKETPEKPNDGGGAPFAADRYNIDLSKITIPEKEAVEEKEEGTAVFDVRQTVFSGYENLKWVDWSGSLPSGAVSTSIQYTKRTDYICSVSNCATGFYTSSKGAYCYYSNADQEYRSSSFKILVNEQNFEVLEWQRHSGGSVPSNAIQRCQNMYVGKNEYGLGKVLPSHGVLSLPYNGKEYFYDSYEVLRLYPDYHSQTITSMTYDTSRLAYVEDYNAILGSKLVMNRGCNTLSTTVSLIETTQISKYWDIGRPTNRDVITSFSGNMPVFTGSSVSYSSMPSFDWKEGYPYIQSRQHSYSLQLTVKPNHECEVVLQGRNLHVRMPFSATLSRSYNNGQRRSVSTQGTFNNLQTDDVVIFARPCKRIINVPPC
ncbi:natterin-4-like [Pyxicephalus adspersus]|uniref:natterin-4-like n=1 Tax=Pyxicephalus adspersus TaxID=30357 RepID=UPI003B5CBC19